MVCRRAAVPAAVVLVLPLGVLPVLLAGCAAHSPPALRTAVLAPEGDDRPLTPRAVYPALFSPGALSAGPTRWRALDADPPVLLLERRTYDDDALTLELVEPGSGGADAVVVRTGRVLARTAEGGIELRALMLSDPARRIVFSPPLVVYPPSGLMQGEVFESAAACEVFERGRAEGSAGRATWRVERTGEVELLGGGRAVVVDAVFELALGPARVERRTRRVIVPGEGDVAAATSVRTRVMGLAVSSRGETIEREGFGVPW